jgi:hypothetical protein
MRRVSAVQTRLAENERILTRTLDRTRSIVDRPAVMPP